MSEDAAGTEPRLDGSEMERLLRRAAAAVAAAVRGDSPALDPGARRESEPAFGCFVTLRHRGELAGCIGYVEAELPLGQQIVEAARAAATRDDRFRRLQPADLAATEVEISILSALEPVLVEDVVVGRDGLVLRGRGRSGLLLPQVAVEHRLDREGLLRALCRKAELPWRAWEDPAVELLRFGAQIHVGPCLRPGEEGN